MRPMNEREIFTSDATVVQVDEQDPQQMQVRKRISACFTIESYRTTSTSLCIYMGEE